VLKTVKPGSAALKTILAISVTLAYVVGVAVGLLHPYTELIKSNKYLNMVSNLPLFWEFIAIYLNNMAVSLIIFVFSLTVLLGFYQVLINGYAVGTVIALAQENNIPVSKILSLLLPHGVIEIPVMLYAAFLGIQLPFFINRKNVVRKAVLAKTLKGLLTVSVLLFIAAFIEAFITPIIAALVTS
jgi:stage II sporulation protein M